MLGSLVLKHGIGVRDAWAREGMKAKEIEQTFSKRAAWISLGSLQTLSEMSSAIFWWSGTRPDRRRHLDCCNSLKP